MKNERRKPRFVRAGVPDFRGGGAPNNPLYLRALKLGGRTSVTEVACGPCVGRASTVQYKYKRALFSPSIQIKVKKMDIFGDFKKISTKNWRGAWRTKVRTQVFKLRVKICSSRHKGATLYYGCRQASLSTQASKGAERAEASLTHLSFRAKILRARALHAFRNRSLDSQRQISHSHRRFVCSERFFSHIFPPPEGRNPEPSKPLLIPQQP